MICRCSLFFAAGQIANLGRSYIQPMGHTLESEDPWSMWLVHVDYQKVNLSTAYTPKVECNLSMNHLIKMVLGWSTIWQLTIGCLIRVRFVWGNRRIFLSTAQLHPPHLGGYWHPSLGSQSSPPLWQENAFIFSREKAATNRSKKWNLVFCGNWGEIYLNHWKNLPALLIKPFIHRHGQTMKLTYHYLVI